MNVSAGRVVLGGVFLLFSYFVVRKTSLFLARGRAVKKHGCKPANQLPQWERIIGYGYLKEITTAVANKQYLEVTGKFFRMCGNTFSGVLMARPFIFTIEPENVKAVLATNFGDYGIRGRKESFGPLLGNGIFTSDGAQWEHSRALIRPSFVKTQISDLDLYETHVQHMMSLIPRDGSTVDLQPLFFRFTMDSSTEYLFGKSVNSLQNSDGPEKEFSAAMGYALSQVPIRYRQGVLSRLMPDKKFSEACKTVKKYAEQFVDIALAGNDEKEDGRYTLLYELAKATRNPIQIRDELLNILAAGRDAMASLLSNVMWILARRPDVWEKLRTEVSTLDGKKPDYDSLRQMKYLKYILNETLRLYPIVTANSRFAIRNTTLPRGGGFDGTSPVFVAKGQIVSWSIRDMQRRTDIYGPDAAKFNPDRWETLRPGWAYVPFNGGPRICIGQQFAMTEISYVIVRIVQTFKGIEKRDEMPWTEKLGLSLSNYYGAKVALTN